MSNKKIISIATLPHRSDSLSKVVGSLSAQIDELHVYRGDNEFGDANKFKGVCMNSGYLMTFDDDILPPPGYVDYMIEKIEQYNRKAVISLHGKILRKQKIDSFYGRDFIKLRCLDEVKRDTPCHIIGTGCMAWHSDLIWPKMEWFHKKNIADILFSKECVKNGVKRVVAAHEKGWLKNINTDDSTCYIDNKDRDEMMTRMINATNWEDFGRNSRHNTRMETTGDHNTVLSEPCKDRSKRLLWDQ